MGGPRPLAAAQLPAVELLAAVAVGRQPAAPLGGWVTPSDPCIDSAGTRFGGEAAESCECGARVFRQLELRARMWLLEAPLPLHRTQSAIKLNLQRHSHKTK